MKQKQKSDTRGWSDRPPQYNISMATIITPRPPVNNAQTGVPLDKQSLTDYTKGLCKFRAQTRACLFVVTLDAPDLFLQLFMCFRRSKIVTRTFQTLLPRTLATRFRAAASCGLDNPDTVSLIHRMESPVRGWHPTTMAALLDSPQRKVSIFSGQTSIPRHNW